MEIGALQTIGFLITHHFQIMSMAALSAFEFANLAASSPTYEVKTISEAGGPVSNSLGMRVETSPMTSSNYDTLLVTGNMSMTPTSQAVVEFLQMARQEVRRIGSICTGAFVLAEAGLLDGHRATTHWAHAEALAARFPAITVEKDRIFIADDALWTSAGMSAGIDMALAMIEKDLGADIAREVAKKLVVYHRRAGGQSQYSALLDISPRSDRVQRALEFARGHLTAALSVEQLAEAANLSPRQFSRQFRLETGKSPAKAVEQLRVEAARLMMEQGHFPMDVIARESGFGGRERMRRAFVRHYGQPPQTLRQHFGMSLTA